MSGGAATLRRERTETRERAFTEAKRGGGFRRNPATRGVGGGVTWHRIDCCEVQQLGRDLQRREAGEPPAWKGEAASLAQDLVA
ncbi:hypothetical protein GUJ93_ZPchr0007g5819 [Zizania palustris]|uniref:Uncharacterized protein n=1 Tax=Zizania palustris TaxID=103762 RepID=A0A8J5T6W0_ZIZPA|nr:hypothetical protein GUJ93_ZPchr0007g5819 [Zizania palustris]